MIDIHCHILFGVDDGAKTEEDTIEMLRIAHQDGLKKIVATSHCLPGLRYDNEKATLKPVFDRCVQLIKENQFDLELIFGSELMATPLSLEWLKEDRIPTINATKWLLLELPWHSTNMFELDPDLYLKTVLELGYKVMIAHPERYPTVQQEYALMEKWRQMGCCFQVNRTSFTDDHDLTVRELAWKILKDGYCDIIASDAHRHHGSRVNKLSDIYALIRSTYDEATAKRLMVDNPQRMIDGLDLELR
jgi:protein-tyrosine phosphatase